MPRTIKVPKTAKSKVKVAGSKIADKIAEKRKTKPTTAEVESDSDAEYTDEYIDLNAVQSSAASKTIADTDVLQILNEIRGSLSTMAQQKLESKLSKTERLKTAKEEKLKAKEESAKLKEESAKRKEESAKRKEEERRKNEENLKAENLKQMAALLNINKEQLAAKLSNTYSTLRVNGLRL